MSLKDFPIGKIIFDTIASVVKLFDNFYNKGWFLYLIVGLFILVFAIMFWK